MVSGKVGGWRNKLTILQGQFWIETFDITFENIIFEILRDSKTLKSTTTL